MTRTLKDRYELGEVIGAGGSARVHAAHDLLLDRQVAVKVLDDQRAVTGDPAARERFLQEAQSAARFVHPHAVAVYDAGQDDGCLFIVMELIDGPTLAERIAAQAPLPEADIVRIGSQVLDALGAAHAVGLVHRDVKPANVLLDAAGNARLADFGIAKRFDDLSDSLTAEGMVIGTVNYLAPEQAAGGVVTPVTDLYAVGAVLYEMSTGSRPALAAGDPRVHRPGLAAPIATTVARALAVNPADRFGSADLMSAALRGAPTPTRVLPVAATGAATMGGVPGYTEVMPASMTPSAPASRASRWWAAAVVALVALGAGAIALAVGGDDGSGATEALSNTGAGPITQPEVSSTPTTPAPTTLAPTTLAPTTPAPTTLAPTTLPVTTVIPGFPATNDPEQFIAQLRADRDIAGRNTKRLADGLDRLIDRPPKQDEVDDFARDIEEWVDEGRLDERIAIAALGLLDGLVVDAGGDTGDDDGDD